MLHFVENKFYALKQTIHHLHSKILQKTHQRSTIFTSYGETIYQTNSIHYEYEEFEEGRRSYFHIILIFKTYSGSIYSVFWSYLSFFLKTNHLKKKKISVAYELITYLIKLLNLYILEICSEYSLNSSLYSYCKIIYALKILCI